jgi:hypothetical protein
MQGQAGFSKTKEPCGTPDSKSAQQEQPFYGAKARGLALAAIFASN